VAQEPRALRWPPEIEQELEQSVGVSRKLLDSLESDDDWTFLIKMHGILEAGLNHLLLTRLSNPDLSRIVAFLPTNDQRTGKLAFIKAYKLLSEEACLFVRVLSEVRNRAVHDVKNFDLNLVEYVRQLDANQRENWQIAMTSWDKNKPILASIKRVTLTHPRVAILNSCMSIMFECLINVVGEGWHSKRQ